MRLHKFIEHLEKINDENIHAFSKYLKERYYEIAQFDLGDLTRIDDGAFTELQDYGMDLLQNGLLPLSYPQLCYSFSDHGVNSIFVCFADETGYFICCFSDEAKSVFNKIGAELAYFLFILEYDENKNIKCSCACNAVGLPDNDENREATKGVCEAANAKFVQLTCLINSKGIEQKIHEAPTKLNKKREKRGLLPINTITEIIIKVGGRSYSSEGLEKGSHASPRMHWRRGHVRRLPSGDITNVRPCLVGDVGGETPSLPSYRVAMGGN